VDGNPVESQPGKEKKSTDRMSSGESLAIAPKSTGGPSLAENISRGTPKPPVSLSTTDLPATGVGIVVGFPPPTAGPYVSTADPAAKQQ